MFMGVWSVVLSSWSIVGRREFWNDFAWRGRWACVELGEDVHQFVDAVGAGVAREDGLVAVGGEAAGGFGVVQQRLEVADHFRAGLGDEVIFAGGEEAFGVVPRRADERDAAGQGFEGADRG